MSKIVKLKKGFDIEIKGEASSEIEKILPETFAVKPTDFVGFSKPKVLVKEGDRVKAGDPLYFDKSLEEVKFCSPVSGEVLLVNRGAKRKLLEIVVKADQSIEYVSHKQYSVSDISNLPAEEIKEHMSASGVWPNIIQRPYAVIANPKDTPRDIFISGFDTSPLAPDTSLLLKGQEEYFAAGIQVLKKLTKGDVHLNVDADAELPQSFTKVSGIQINKFSGPHPAGAVGVQIHHIAPISAGEIVWTVSPLGVSHIGKLFVEGKYDASRIIALTGSEVKNPKHYQTYIGANVAKYLENNLNSEHVRVVSGNILTGEKIEKDGFVGFYDKQVTVIPEGDDFIPFGSFVPTKDRLSFHRAFGLMSFVNNFINPNKKYTIDTNIQGEHRPFVQTGVFEKVTPMDILPMQLMKAIMAEDYEEMEALGIYEVAEEDLALCEFVDASKTEVQAVIRRGIELLQQS